MEFRGELYTGDYTCFTNLENEKFVKESVNSIENIYKIKNYKHWKFIVINSFFYYNK